MTEADVVSAYVMQVGAYLYGSSSGHTVNVCVSSRLVTNCHVLANKLSTTEPLAQLVTLLASLSLSYSRLHQATVVKVLGTLSLRISLLYLHPNKRE